MNDILHIYCNKWNTLLNCLNSNITLSNNVFQNTQRYYIPPVGISAGQMYGGNAINDENYYMNSKLDLSSSTVGLGNRFWNCHTAIKAHNLLRLNVEKALFRSTQTNTASGLQQGSNGLQLSTNRFQYFIKDNEFTNIAYPINIPIAADVYTTISTGTQTGIYADKIIVLKNTFASGATSGENINTAINITCPNQYTYTIANDYMVVPYTKAIVVEQNTMTAVERGVAINGIAGFQTTVESNSITLRGASSSSQHGIDLSACVSASNVVGQQMIITNTITGAVPSASLESLVFRSDNIGRYSPSVTCNSLSNSHQGFVFNSSNTLAVWAGNIMQPLNRGLVLTGFGRIGAQGTSSIASNNQWRSTWTNDQTYVDNTSNAANSILFVKSGSATTPSINGGPISAQSFVQSGNLQPSVGGDYECGGVPNSKTINPPTHTNFSVSIEYSAIRSNFYRFLFFNDSIREPVNSCDEYYQSLSTSNTAKLMEVETKLFSGEVADAISLNDDIIIDDLDPLEENCKSFYQLYATYQQLPEDSSYAVTDSTSLFYLAGLCPASNGPCVYQARALINTIYLLAPNFSDCDEETGARSGISHTNNSTLTEQALNDLYKVFPNPAGTELQILCKSPNSELQLEIKDLFGRTVHLLNLNVIGNTITLHFDLPNGAYFLIITDSQNEQKIQKLLVSK